MTQRSSLFALVGLVLLLSGCAATMKEQPKYEPLAYSEFYPDGRSARYAPANTIARGVTANEDPALAAGAINGTPVPDFPFPLTVDDLKRGEGLYNDTCAPCHGRTGAGDGIVVQRGFTKPPALTAPNIVALPPGQVFGFITNGFGAMPPYGQILQPTDRWRVAGYLRALQASQNGTLNDVPPDVQNQIKPGGRTVVIFHTYLTAYTFWLMLAVGCLSILMIHNLAGGYWGAVIRRPLEAAAMTIPLMAVLFIPVLIGMPALFPWIHGDVLASPEATGAVSRAAEGMDLTFKQVYLSLPFFIARAVVYFIIWIGLALLLVSWSRRRDTDPSPALTARLRNVSAWGLVLMALTVSFAGIDWLMSLDPAWFSSIWGLIVATGALLSGFASATLVVVVRRNRAPFAELNSPALFNSLGSLLLAFLMLWAYMSISQVILYYAGNLPEETVWYVRRTSGGWILTALAVLISGFVVPFAFLVIRGAKRNPLILGAVCALILVTHYVNLYWIVQPTFNDNTFIAGIVTAVLGVVMGGLWLIAWSWQFGKAPEVSPVEPKLIAAREAHEAALREHAARGSHAVAAGEQAHD